MSRRQLSFGRARWFGPGRPLVLLGLAGAAVAGGVMPLIAGPARRHIDAAVIPIRGEINDILKESVQRRADQALGDGAKTLIFELETPGGLVTSALEICRMIKDLPRDVHSVAWVHHRAYSAGAMISVANRQILMSSTSSIGDCAPIMVGPAGGLEELPKTERAKAESPVLQEFRDSAARNGYDPLLLRAMVTVGEEIWWVRNLETGEQRFVSGTEKVELVDKAEKDKARWQLVESYTDPISKREVPAKQPVDSADALLTLSQSEAVVYGLATGIAPDLDAVAEQLHLASAPVYYEITAWERFVIWLNSPIIRGILFAIVLVGAYMEFQHPGLILPGMTAAVALVIFLAAPYAAGLANVWTFVLLGVGVVLLAVEVLLIPGHGISGVIGVVLILIAVIGTFVPSEPVPDPSKAPWFSLPTLPGTWDALKRGILYMSGSVCVSFIGILLVLRYLPRMPVSRGVVLATPDAATLTLSDPHPDVALIGDVGVVTGDLRPGGQARFGPEIVDVQSQGEYVEAGRRVQVIKREGMTIVVRPLPSDQNNT